AITSGGAIPDVADYDVVEEPHGLLVGKVNEDFAVESMRGDIFLLGNKSWRILRVEAGRMRVEDAGASPPTIPFWMGEAPSRTRELSVAVGRLREEVAADPGAAMDWLRGARRLRSSWPTSSRDGPRSAPCRRRRRASPSASSTSRAASSS